MESDKLQTKGKVSTGFGAKSIVGANPLVPSLSSLEATIQKKIDSEPGLRESMKLMDELREFDTVFSSMSVVEQSMRISPKQIQEMQGKQTRLQELHNSLGWSKPMVHNKLQEITWDTT
eukprot:gene25480-33252_t